MQRKLSVRIIASLILSVMLFALPVGAFIANSSNAVTAYAEENAAGNEAGTTDDSDTGNASSEGSSTTDSSTDDGKDSTVETPTGGDEADIGGSSDVYKRQAVQSKKSGKSLFERFTGLTLAEFLKLKKLKKTLSGDNGQSGKQISTQQTITFDKMYQDGICKVRKNYYTKKIEFYDLNYVLLDEEERADILGLYSQLINYFDPTINFQIFLFNRHVNEETLAAQFEISPQGDKFDDIREEFSDMLKMCIRDRDMRQQCRRLWICKYFPRKIMRDGVTDRFRILKRSARSI